jgi:guanylate kinase
MFRKTDAYLLGDLAARNPCARECRDRYTHSALNFMNASGKLVVLSGPSCIGKSSLIKALAQFHPQLHKKLQPLVLLNSRSPRPGERDGEAYHFRRREEIERLRARENFVVMNVRSDLQALNLEELRGLLEKGNVLFEGNPFIGCTLLTHAAFRGVETLSVFISPLGREELSFLMERSGSDLKSLVADVMRRKLLRRMQRQKTLLSQRDLEEVERRAGSSFRELSIAHHFEHVIANHDGEDSENWNAFYFPLGDARRTLNAFVALLEGVEVHEVEHWEKDFLSCTRDRFALRNLNSMKTGYLIQDVRRIELGNLTAKREGGSFITGDVANQNVSPSVGDASLVIDGEEFAGNVFRYTGSQVIFESDRFEEIAKKLS